MSDASDSDAAEVGVGGEVLDDLMATSERTSAEAKATDAMMILLCSMVETPRRF
jgi:hypothetical protein